MGRRLNIVFLATIAIAVMLQNSSAQTAYVVGDTLGWVVPPGSGVYTTWAANKTFRVGDTLVFNFTNGAHNVARVTRVDFNSCNASNPLLLISNGPANVTLNETGNHYFLCGFPGHCIAGQRLAINVSAAASSPAPQPSTPAPQPFSPAPQPTTPPPTPASAPQPSVPAPAPQAGSPSPTSAPTLAPTRSPMTYTVGDTMGWTIPTTGGASAYERWANGKAFMVGDILVFNYVTGAHDVAEVTREAYQTCNTSNLLSNFTTGPTRITLETSGEHFYICAVPGHCSAGQKLSINVTGSSTATPPSSSSPSPSTVVPPSSTTSPPSPTGDNTATPPSSGNSATSLGVAGLSATLLSVIVAVFM
ncbi:hypothetical protein PTKIN_Ptkin03bG0161000 [Pterospermum kingtungense]